MTDGTICDVGELCCSVCVSSQRASVSSRRLLGFPAMTQHELTAGNPATRYELMAGCEVARRE